MVMTGLCKQTTPPQSNAERQNVQHIILLSAAQLCQLSTILAMFTSHPIAQEYCNYPRCGSTQGSPVLPENEPRYCTFGTHVASLDAIKCISSHSRTRFAVFQDAWVTQDKAHTLLKLTTWLTPSLTPMRRKKISAY